jgi:phospholipase/carboxylesterase
MLRMAAAAGARASRWRRVRRWIVAGLVLAFLYNQLAPRPAFLPLATRVDGPAPSGAKGVVVFLHGRGGSVGRTFPTAGAHDIVRRLRDAGLPSDYAIVTVEGPYPTPFRLGGHHWGDSNEAQATTRARVRERLDALLGPGGPLPAHVVIAGFSQGAGLAIDLAVEDPRFGKMASFSPCKSALRGDLPKREGLRVLLAHGSRDAVCPVEESRSLARVLEAAHKNAQYMEFDDGHVVPAEVLRALVALATAP